MPAAPKTLEEVAALASIRVDDLKEFKEADFEELTRELGIPVTAKVKLRGLFRKLLASERVSTAQAKFEAFFERVGKSNVWKIQLGGMVGGIVWDGRDVLVQARVGISCVGTRKVRPRGGTSI